MAIRHDLHHNILAIPSITSRTIGSNTTVVGSVIPVTGYGALEFTIQSAAITDGTFTPLLEESMFADFSTSQVVDPSNIFDTIAGATFTNANANSTKQIGYLIGVFPYVRLSLVSTGVTTGGVFSATAIQGNPDLVPTGPGEAIPGV